MAYWDPVNLHGFCELHLKLEISEKALNLIADLGYDPQFGARPLKRVIENELVNELAMQVLSGKYIEGDTIFVDADNKGFIFSEEGYKGDGTIPSVSTDGEQNKVRRREKQVVQLKKATQDVNDLVKDIKDEDDDNNEDDHADPKSQPKKQ